jgi:hypothetical protein
MSTDTHQGAAEVDIRGPRFTAWVTTAVLVLALLVSAVTSIGAAFGICLGCQLYPLVTRLRKTPTPA